MEREVALIKAWITAMNLKFKQGASQKEKIEQLKKQIRDRMRKAFGLT